MFHFTAKQSLIIPRRRENKQKLCVTARQGRNLAPQQDTTQGNQHKTLRRGKTRAQSRTTTGHDAGKTAKNLASRHGKIKHNTIPDTTQRKHSKTLRRGTEEGEKLAMLSRFWEDRNVKRMVCTKTVHGFIGKAWKIRRLKRVSATVYLGNRGGCVHIKSERHYNMQEEHYMSARISQQMRRALHEC